MTALRSRCPLPLRLRILAVSVAVVLIAGACGSRLSQTEIAADARGAGGSDLGAGAQQASGSGGPAVLGSTSATGSSSPVSSGSGSGIGTGSSALRGGGGANPASAGAGGGAGSVGGAPGPAVNRIGGGSGSPGGALAPIVIGNVSSLSGPAGAAQAPGVQGFQLWVRWINAQGGIKGHPVQLYVEDDASDPAQHAAEVEDLVNNKHVVALVDDWASQTDQGGEQFIDQHQIPVIGGDSSLPLWYQDPMFFPDGPNSSSNYLADYELYVARHYAPQAGSNLGILVCVEASICSNYAGGMRSQASTYGYRVAYDGSGSLAQPDYTANCLSARSANVGVLAMEFDGASIKRIGRSCSSQGYKPVYGLSGAVDSTFQGDPTWDGSVLWSPVFPFLAASSPAIAQFQAAVQKYDPNAVLGGIFAAGWVSGKELEQAAQNLGATPTSQDLLAGLWSFHNQTLGGLVGPLTFGKGKPAADMRCIFPMTIKNEKFVAPLGGNDICV